MKSTFARRMSIILVLAMVLAMLPMGALAADNTTLYLQPNENWLKDGARFAAYFFGNGETWVSMTDSDADGIYEVEAPAGYPSVIFCRMNPNASANNWKNKWNQTSNLAVPTDGTNLYSVAPGSWDKGKGSWSTYTVGEEVTVPTTVAKLHDYYLAGDFNDWNEWNEDYGLKLVDGVYTLTLELAAGLYTFKVTDGTWTNSWGLNGTDSNYEFVLDDDATVVFTFDATTKIPTVESASMGEVTIYDYYLTGEMNGWTVNSSEMGLTANGDGTYSITIDMVAGTYAYKFTDGTWDVCFPAGTDNGSLVVDTDCAVTFTLDPVAGTFTATGDGIAVTPDDPITGDVYNVKGDVAGLDWDLTTGTGLMTKNEDGSYSLVIADVAAATKYFIKVVKNNSWDFAIGGTGAGGNYEFAVTDVCDVTITVAADGTLSVSGEYVTAAGLAEIVIDSVYVAGSGDESGNGFLYGVNWDPASSVNQMTFENGVYTITYTGVAAGTYEFKFALNGGWTYSYASGVEVVSGETTTAWYNPQGNSTLVVAADNSTVTLVLDLSAVKYEMDNAQMTVTIEEAASIKDNAAPEQIVIGNNDFAFATGNREPVTAPYTATFTGTLYIYPTAMTVVDNWSGTLQEVPASAINMQFGRMYGIVVDGMNVWGNQIEVVEGQTYQIGIIDNMAGGCMVTLTVCSGHNFVDGVCSVCGYVCANHNWDNGTCLICGATCDHENWDGGWCTNCWMSCEHSWTYTYTKNGAHTFTCSGICGASVTVADVDGQKFGLKGASPVLSDDIVMVYETFIPAGFSDAYMVFEFNGETFYAWESEYVAATGRTCFRFPGLNPQKMGDNISATLYAYVEGYEVSVSMATYSMVQYCDRQLKNASTSAALRTALSDLLVYGEMNQIYEDYKTDALCTSLLSEGVVLTPSTFPAAGVDASWNVQGMSGTKLEDCTFTGVGVTLGAKIVIGLNVTCTDIERFSFKVTIGDMTYDVAGSDLVPTGVENKYVLNFDKITAIQLGETITFTIWEGDVQVSRTATYSVYSYIYKNQNAADTNLVNLLKAIYNYGESVKKL